MTDKEKLNWVKEQLYRLGEVISESNGETVEETDISDCLWRIINGYDLFGGSEDKVEW
jgi:hypothetical protein